MAAGLPLSTLLSQALVAFTIEFDNEFEHQMPHRTSRGPAAGAPGHWLVSLAMWSNLMRFLPEEGVPVGELPALTGMSHEAVASSLRRMGQWWGISSSPRIRPPLGPTRRAETGWSVPLLPGAGPRR